METICYFRCTFLGDTFPTNRLCLTFQVLTLFQVTVLFLGLTIHSTNGQIGELAKKLLPEWMTENLANLISPTAPPEKRILFKLNGNNGFYIRKVPTRGLVARPSKYYIKYAHPQSQHYKMFRPPPGNYIGHPYQFEKITVKPQFDYLFEKPSIPLAYQDPAPYPYYPPQQTARPLRADQFTRFQHLIWVAWLLKVQIRTNKSTKINPSTTHKFNHKRR